MHKRGADGRVEGLAQILGILGALLIFALWQLTPRRRHQGAPTLSAGALPTRTCIPDLGLRRPRAGRVAN